MYKIDSHKLKYHPGRVSQWNNGQNIYPIYIEVSPFGGCNHRCIYCGLDYLEYDPISLDVKILKKFINDSRKHKVKSILYAGSGEPFLHKDIVSLIQYTKKQNIDTAVVSNGVLFSKNIARDSLKYLSWIKISLDAADSRTHAAVHGTSQKDFNIILDNIANAVSLKKKYKYQCTIGAQFLLLPQNHKEAVPLVKKLKKINVDYLVVKPYSQHPLSKNRLAENIEYKDFFHLEKTLSKYSDSKFTVIFRRNSMEKLNTDKSYSQCLGMGFWTYLSEHGDLYPCIRFLGQKEFVFGNIYNDSFADIWQGQTRKRIMNRIHKKWDVKSCRRLCRLDEINEYLWDLKNPPKHVNFI